MLRDIAQILLGATLIALASQCSMELNLGAIDQYIPITGQTLAVITLSMILAKYNAVLAVIIYLLAGGLGLPVFADGEAGWSHLAGATAGYLWSFILVAWLLDRHDFAESSYKELLLIQLLATILILALGWFRLSFVVEEAYTKGVEPFLIGGVLKSLVGALLVWIYYRMVRVKR